MVSACACKAVDVLVLGRTTDNLDSCLASAPQGISSSESSRPSWDGAARLGVSWLDGRDERSLPTAGSHRHTVYTRQGIARHSIILPRPAYRTETAAAAAASTEARSVENIIERHIFWIERRSDDTPVDSNQHG